MKFRFSYFSYFIVLLLSNKVLSQEEKTENFVFIHTQFELNNRGAVITPIDPLMNKRISSFIEAKFYGLVESARNIVWESYETDTNPNSKSHVQRYAARVHIKNNNQSIEYRYLEVEFYPTIDEIKTNYKFNESKRNFVLTLDEKARRSYLPNLIELGIKDAPIKATIDNLVQEHKQLIIGVNSGLVSFYQGYGDGDADVFDVVTTYVEKAYPRVKFVMNLVWDSYHTLVSNYDSFHYHTFIVQVKLNEMEGYQFIEVFYNPTTNSAISDFKWNEKEEFYFREQHK